jgi:hypothetical protein
LATLVVLKPLSYLKGGKWTICIITISAKNTDANKKRKTVYKFPSFLASATKIREEEKKRKEEDAAV